jgi:hemophore-related protein
MNAQSPAAAAQFNETPMAQNFLQTFINSPPPQREQMLQQARGIPEAAPYVGLITPLAKTCSRY